MIWLILIAFSLMFCPPASAGQTHRKSLAKPCDSRQIADKPWRWRRHRGPGVDPLAQPPPLAG
jgi:hypothetical protein